MNCLEKQCTDNSKRYFLYKMLSITSILLFVPILGALSWETKSKDWDILIFTQRWPITACSQWKQHSLSNTCTFPEIPGIWSIHGIWPTKFGTKGPWNCNNTWHFNETIIKPIETDLENYWVNVENNTALDSLWEHEWLKHGTCAAILPALSNELKYFKQGLEWIKKFNMQSILNLGKIAPNENGYSIDDINNAITKALGKNPIIECVMDRKTRSSLISEIRICFDKELNLTDCDLVGDSLGRYIRKIGNVHTNCNIKKVVIYPSQVHSFDILYRPTTAFREIDPEELNSLLATEKYLMTIYNTLKLLMWATV